MESLSNIASLKYFLPELILSSGMLAVILGDLATRGRGRALNAFLTLGALIAATVAALRLYGTPPMLLFSDMIAIDPFAIYFKLIFYASTALIVVVAHYSQDTRSGDLGEMCALLLAIAVGMSLMASSVDLVMM